MKENKLINVSESTIIKRGTIWNLIASLLNSFMSAFLLVFITRINGVDLAGVFSFAAAISYQCLSLGAFGVRNFQSSDVKKEYLFSDYFYLRIFSSILMYGLLLYYAFGNGYSLEKAMIVLTFGIFKSVDAIEDVYHGEYHRYGRVDVGAILQSIRYMVSLILFVGGLVITKNLVFTCGMVACASMLIFVVQNKKYIHYFVSEKLSFNFVKVKELFFLTVPICISNLINMYVVNSPKYAIDANLSSEFQAYYGYLSMPVFTISLLSTVIYRPYISKMAEDWQDRNIKKFNKQVFKQVCIILFLTISITTFGFIIGLTLIEILYGVELSKYMLDFMVLLLSGGLNTMASFFAIVMTIQREQKKIIFGYLTALIFVLSCSKMFVLQFGMLGASLLYMFTSLILMLIFTFIVLYKCIIIRKGDL